jgi:hypothetical protein
MSYKIIIFKNATTMQPVSASFSHADSKVERSVDRVAKVDALDGKAFDIESKNHPEFLKLKNEGNLIAETFVNEKYTDENGYFKIPVKDKKGANNLKANVLRHVTNEWNAFFKSVA